MRTPQTIDMTLIRARAHSLSIDLQVVMEALGAPLNKRQTGPVPAAWAEPLERFGILTPKEALELSTSQQGIPERSKTHAMRCMLTNDQKRVMFDLRARVHQEKGRGFVPSEQDVLHIALARLAQQHGVAWPTSPKLSKANPPKAPDFTDPTRIHTTRAVLSALQKIALVAVREAIRVVDARAFGHAYTPSESEVIDRALNLLATSYGMVWPARSRIS